MKLYSHTLAKVFGLIVITLSLSAPAQPANADNGKRFRGQSRPTVVRNQMYYKNRYYPIGYRVRTLPRGYFSLSYGNGRYYYHSGVYYRRHGSNYIVVRAPRGAYINVLPYGYRTFYFGGIPYFYASGVFYNWNNRYRAYEVVERPDSLDGLEEEQVADAREVFVYPARGQTTEQTSQDRYECYLWAVDQTGFDPGSEERGDVAGYRRALEACLEGRGYTVK